MRLWRSTSWCTGSFGCLSSLWFYYVRCHRWHWEMWCNKLGEWWHVLSQERIWTQKIFYTTSVFNWADLDLYKIFTYSNISVILPICKHASFICTSTPTLHAYPITSKVTACLTTSFSFISTYCLSPVVKVGVADHYLEHQIVPTTFNTTTSLASISGWTLLDSIHVLSLVWAMWFTLQQERDAYGTNWWYTLNYCHNECYDWWGGSLQDSQRSINVTNQGDAPWNHFNLSYQGETNASSPLWQMEDFPVWFWDPLTLIHNLLSNSDLDGGFDYSPFQEHDTDNKHQYENFMSGNWSWKQVVCLIN